MEEEVVSVDALKDVIPTHQMHWNALTVEVITVDTKESTSISFSESPAAPG